MLRKADILGRGYARWLALLLLPVVTACSAGHGEETTLGSEGQPPADISETEVTLEGAFAEAAADWDVPVQILESIAWVETSWHMIDGEAEFDGQEPAFGVMALRGAQLEEAAALIDAAVEDVQSDLFLNVSAAAALLSSYADELEIDRADVGAWAEVAAEYSGIQDIQGQAHYIHAELYDVIKNGISTEALTMEPIDVTPKFVLMDSSSNPGPDYAESIYRPSPNWSYRPSGTVGTPQMVIIHTCEGSYSGCWSWLTNSASGVSAHYVVNNSGSEISQLVPESRKAWHIGATYKCSNNSGTSCNLNGYGSNNFTVGIEHAGYASQASWSSGLIDSSSKLVCDITKDHGIPRDKYHIVGHGQLQPYNRVDPGPNWPWTSYINKVNTYCGGGGTPTPDPPDTDPPDDPPAPGSLNIVIDSNNAANGGDAQIKVSGNWTASNNVSGYYNTGYWWRSTGASSDLAEFQVHLPSAKKVVVEAWWSSAYDRSPNAPWLITDANGNHLDTVYVNQQQNGGKWVQLGTYDLPAGWNTVALSRWTGSGYVVVADAVRVREVQ